MNTKNHLIISVLSILLCSYVYSDASVWRLKKGTPSHPYPLSKKSPLISTWRGSDTLKFSGLHVNQTNAIVECAFENDEVICGAGETFNTWNLRGTERTTWCQDSFAWHDAAYFAVPLYISSRGYALFFNCSGRVKIDWPEIGGTSQTLRVTLPEPGIDMYIFEGTPLEITQAYTEFIGRPVRVPEWIFQPWFSRNSYMTSKEIDDIIAKAHSLDLHIGAVVLECWAESLQSFTFETNRYPHPKEWIQKLHDQGVHVVLWETPSIWTSSPTYKTAKEKKYIVLNKDGSEKIVTWLENGRKIDFRKKAAVQWWQKMHQPLIKMGVDGFKTDGGERGSGDFFHNIHPCVYQKSVLDAFAAENRRGITFARSAGASCTRNATFWGGDQKAEWSYLPDLIRAGISAGICGFPFWGHDIGGYTETPSQELYIRWMQFGTFTPIMQFHGITPREPWHFGDKAIEIAQKYFRIRENLRPYIKAMATRVYSHGTPIMRPLAWEWPDEKDAWTCDDQYMFGEYLLIAPILQPSLREIIPANVLRTPKGEPGLRGEFFNAKECTGNAVSRRVTPTIDFDWKQKGPGHPFGTDAFAIRWTGTLGPVPTSGMYAITVQSDDGVKLWIDDACVIDKWYPRTLTEDTIHIELQTGKVYKVKLDYFEDSGEAVCRLLWQPPGHSAAVRDVWLPPGDWRDAWTGKQYKGGQTITYSASLDTIPVFIKEKVYKKLETVFQNKNKSKQNKTNNGEKK